MHWSVAPGRYMLGNRQWITRSRFEPLSDVKHAFRLLEASGGLFNVGTLPNGSFTAEVQIGNRAGNACGEPKAACITLAVARAIGINAPGLPADYSSAQLSDAAEGRESR
jgi:hypothetical protein